MDSKLQELAVPGCEIVLSYRSFYCFLFTGPFTSSHIQFSGLFFISFNKESLTMKKNSPSLLLSQHASWANRFHNSIQFYLYSIKSQQKSSQGTFHIEQIWNKLFTRGLQSSVSLNSTYFLRELVQSPFSLQPLLQHIEKLIQLILGVNEYKHQQHERK